MDINQCYELVKDLADKSGYGSYISPNQFNTAWQSAERKYFAKKVESYGLNQKIDESILPFKTDPLTIAIDATGQYTKPSDLLFVDSIRHVYEGVEQPVERVNDDRLANHLSSSYDAPTAQFPIYVEYAEYIQFYPITLASAKLVYLQSLATPTSWGYTLVSSRPVYDVATSVQPKWKEMDLDNIAMITLSIIGENMRDQELQAFSERKLQTGL